MILKSLSNAFIASSLLASSLAWADPMAVKNGVVFVLTGTNLQVYPVSPTAVLPAGCVSPLTFTTATNILISGNRAIVTPGHAGAVIDSFDISACLSGDFYNAQADLRAGTLEIACALIDDGSKKSYYNVNMQRRGNSTNWDVTFATPNLSCTGP